MHCWQFGNLWSRLIRGGVVLSPIEQAIFSAFVERIPSNFRSVVEAQLTSVNLAQRHVEWRGIYLYRVGVSAKRAEVPLLPCQDGECPLLRLEFLAEGSPKPIHAKFWSVRRKLFGFDTGESLRQLAAANTINVLKVHESWRSAVHA